MLDRLIGLIAPHSCIKCTRAGSIMCSACVMDLHETRTNACVGCGRDSVQDGMCAACVTVLPYDSASVFARRDGPVEELINAYKFSRVRAAYVPLADMIASLLPKGAGYAVVPVPTIGRHVRQRGYDHAALLARRVARSNGNAYAPLIRRRTRTVQHGADKTTRLNQAADAFYIAGPVNPRLTYMILDDITTTGASLSACANVLRTAGARTVIAAAVARQPLD